MKVLKATASQEIPLGRFVDATDGFTAETALTIANTDIQIWKTGATALVSKNSGGATHLATGIYYAVLDATDTDTAGPMKVFCQIAGTTRAFELELEVVTGLSVWDETLTEPSSIFAWASATYGKIAGLLGALGSNKMTETATTFVLRNRADGSNIGSATVSEDGTTTVRGSLT